MARIENQLTGEPVAQQCGTYGEEHVLFILVDSPEVVDSLRLLEYADTLSSEYRLIDAHSGREDCQDDEVGGHPVADCTLHYITFVTFV